MGRPGKARTEWREATAAETSRFVIPVVSEQQYGVLWVFIEKKLIFYREFNDFLM